MDMHLRTRRYELDWLRVIAILILLVYHVGMIFVSWGWHIQSDATSRPFEIVMGWLHFWRMPLLLFISGAGTCFALRHRHALAYLGERHRRLLIPVIFGIFVIVPPQIYIERIDLYESFLDFYPTIFEGIPYPEGNTSWHHLWFVVYLLIYSIVALPLFLWLRSERSDTWRERLYRLVRKPYGFALFQVPILVSQFLLRPFFPEETHALVDDWAFFTYYLLFFVFGYVCVLDSRIWAEIGRRRRDLLASALVSTALFYVAWFAGTDIPFHVAGSFVAWFMILTSIGYGQTLLSRSHPLLEYANEAIYPFYILHQTVIIMVGFRVLRWSLPLYASFLTILSLSFVATVAIYYLLVRPYDPIRFLFGMKPKLRRAHTAVSATPVLEG